MNQSTGSGFVNAYSVREELEDAKKELAMFRAGLTQHLDMWAIAWGLMHLDWEEAIGLYMRDEGCDLADALEHVWDALTESQRKYYEERAARMQPAMVAWNHE